MCILIFESLLDAIILFQFFLLQQTVHLSSAKVPLCSVLIMSFFFTVFLKLCFLPFEGVFYFLQKFLRGIFPFEHFIIRSLFWAPLSFYSLKSRGDSGVKSAF